MNKNKSDFKQRIAKYDKTLQKLQKELQLNPSISLEFPQYAILPEELKLALIIIQKNKYQFMLEYKDLKDK